MSKASAKVVSISEPTDGGSTVISFSEPYVVTATVQGSADLLFHRWNAEEVEEKAKAVKGSKGKKTDNVESYVFRNDQGFICIPGEYLRGAIVNAAKFKQDPRSPRKSAMDLFKAAIVVDTQLASLGTKDWDYLDKRRVQVQRNGINRVRPAMKAGWTATFDIQCLLPEYVDQMLLREVIDMAGRLVGLADFRPTFGRFGLIRYNVK